jgi:hypothetical protein
MTKDREVEDRNGEAPDPQRNASLQGVLNHLKAYPADDAECVFELKLPLSMLTALMLRGAVTPGGPQSLILDALADAGY